MALVEQTPIVFQIPFQQNVESTGGVVMSVQELTEQYLWGIPLCNPISKDSISHQALKNALLSAQGFVETLLDLKLFKQYIVSQHDFVREEFMSWGYIQTSWALNKIFKLKGRFNEQDIITYPDVWLSIRRSNDGRYNRNLWIVPNAAGTVSFDYNLATFNQWFSFRGTNYIPNYWNVEYLTGFDKIPMEIIELIGKVAAIIILPRIEQIITSNGSLNFGIASNSISMDGISQSVSKANNGNIFQQRIKLLGEQIKEQAMQLKNAYIGITFTVC